MNIQEYWNKKSENSCYLEYLKSFGKSELKNLIREITKSFSESNELNSDDFSFDFKDSIQYVAIVTASYYEYDKLGQNQLTKYIMNMLYQHCRNQMPDFTLYKYLEMIICKTNVISLQEWQISCEHIKDVHSEWIKFENYTNTCDEKELNQIDLDNDNYVNNEQLSVINELENNILLIASAGTGKTDTLSRRVANIINNKRALANEILCITFTNKACKEMKHRIEEIVGKEAKNIIVKTFHSFCLQIIKEYAKSHTDIFIDFTILNEYDCKEIIKKLNYNKYPIDRIYRFVTNVKEKRVELNNFFGDEVEDYKKTIDYLFNNELDIIKSICTIKKNFDRDLEKFFKLQGYTLINQFNNELKNNHCVDFIDLIIQAKFIFEDKDVVEDYRNRYKYINIDEVQDTSITEYKIIENIFESNNILLCGDKFQTIYQWRGSNPNLIQNEFMKYSPKIIKFYKNYRATRNLTNASLDYLKNTFYYDYKKIYNETIEAYSNIEGDKICLKSACDRSYEAKWINEQIHYIFNKNINPGKICVLTRDNSLNIELSNYLLNYNSGINYKYILVDQYKFFRKQEIKDIISFFNIIVNVNDNISLKRILLRFTTGVVESTINNIEDYNHKEVGIKLNDFLSVDNCDYFHSLIQAYVNDEPMIIFDVESTGLDVTKDEIIQIAAIKINKNGHIIETFERFLKPTKNVGKSGLVHGFTDEFLVENGEGKEVVFYDFIKFSKNALIVGHNVQYDINILTSELERIRMDKPKFKKVYDTLDIFRRFYPNLPNHKLDTLSNIFKIKNKPSHNALDDVIATKDLLIFAINEKLMPTSYARSSLMERSIDKFNQISFEINKLREKSKDLRPYEIVDYILENFNFNNTYSENERNERFDRINDFKNFLKEFDDKDKNSRDSLIEVVNLTALSNGELEELMLKKTGNAKIPILTVHQAKGLEFDYVLLAGLEEGRFPNYRSIESGNLDEEKRLFYVAITRAKKKLYLSYCEKNEFGYKTHRSQFIDNVKNKYLI